MTTHEFDSDFEQFFAGGDRITDVAELFAFAQNSERRGHRSEAQQLYRWTAELLDECPPSTDLRELRFEIENALQRLEFTKLGGGHDLEK